jgi:hypothetical protein
MALTYITTIHPSGVDFYLEDALLVPTDLTPRPGSIVIDLAPAADATVTPVYYLKVGASAAGQYVRFVTDFLRNSAGTLTFKPTYWFNLPLTASVGGGTQTAILPVVGAASWQIVDAYIVNTSGGAGGGTVKLQAATGALDITEAMTPGIANEKTPCTILNYANGAMALGTTLNFVKTAGFTASRAFVRVEGV